MIKTKIAIGCLVQWYESEIIGEYVESLKDAIKNYDGEIFVDFTIVQNQDLEVSIKEFAGKNFSELKEKLAEVLVEKIHPISNEINKLLKDYKYIDEILLKGCVKAEKISKKKVSEIKTKIGF